jgi:hypothetical protein
VSEIGWVFVSLPSPAYSLFLFDLSVLSNSRNIPTEACFCQPNSSRSHSFARNILKAASDALADLRTTIYDTRIFCARTIPPDYIYIQPSIIYNIYCHALHRSSTSRGCSSRGSHCFQQAWSLRCVYRDNTRRLDLDK